MVLWRDGALGFYILLLTDQVSIFSSIKSLCSALFYIFSIWHSAVLLYELYFLLFKLDDKVMAFRVEEAYFKTLSNIYDEAFFRNNQQLKAVNYFRSIMEV